MFQWSSSPSKTSSPKDLGQFGSLSAVRITVLHFWGWTYCHNIAIGPVALHDVAHTVLGRISVIFEMPQGRRSTQISQDLVALSWHTQRALQLSRVSQADFQAKVDAATCKCSRHTVQLRGCETLGSAQTANRAVLPWTCPRYRSCTWGS